MILDLDGKRILGLNPVGSFVWSQLDGHRTAGEIAESVAARFAVERERASVDVGSFLSELAARGLVDV